jgi:hypothetical protein
MFVEFQPKRDQHGSPYFEARVESPIGNVVCINPFEPLDISIIHRRGPKGFGVEFVRSGKTRHTMNIGTIGETTTFIRYVKQALKTPGFWEQN